MNPPIVTLVTPTSIDTPYVYLLTIPYNETLEPETYSSTNVTVDRTSSIIVQIRDRNNSIPQSCSNQIAYYSCPISYTSESQSQMQLT